MNTKLEMKYLNEKKSMKLAYLLGAISYIIPLALHKFYLEQYGWAVLYIILISIGLLSPQSLEGALCTLVYSILMLVDIIKTSLDVKSYNEKLLDEYF
jgi:TM2 domain-containing membrane protein YozV